MKRREFISLIGGAVVAWPLAARAQQPTTPLVGFLDSVSVETRRDALVAFRQGLGETGYLENHNVAIEYRWAHGQLNRLPDLAADLVRRQVAVIVVNNAASRAARGATSVTPIVFISARRACGSRNQAGDRYGLSCFRFRAR
jgi:putative ABC transport system substrate-binding protein